MQQYAQPPPCPTVSVDELDQVCGGGVVSDVKDWAKEQVAEARDQWRHRAWSRDRFTEGASEGAGFGLLGILSMRRREGFKLIPGLLWMAGNAAFFGVMKGATGTQGKDAR